MNDQAHRIQADEEGFIPVKSRKKRRIFGSGSAVIQGLQGAPPPLHHVWVSHVKEGDVQSLKSHLHNNAIVVADIEKVSHAESKFGSFKVSIYKTDIDKVMKDSLWPSGVRCELWRDKQRKGNLTRRESVNRLANGVTNDDLTRSSSQDSRIDWE